ncbi:MAG: prolipoprotein diacylglyceryl transferase [Thermoguttaceae bacterium]|nr:prolipoprotein diacylglyceryl transferase [Thermoguttaceae bacterium]MDW8079011.1 prolipoprotein diacylglyceryl transferase [Thermoguttaceae bacterium]
MRSTLFYIPHEFLGMPVFGFGWVLAIWAVVAIALLAQSVRRYGWTRDLLSQIVVALLVGAFIAFLLPQLAEKEGLPIRGYGTMLLLATIAAVGLALWRAPERGLNADLVFSLTLWVFLVGIAGARLFYVIEYWDRIRVVDGSGNLLWFRTFVNAINLTQGGLVVYGSIFGGIVAIIVFARRTGLPLLGLMDFVAPSFMLGLALGRLGCFLNGCCFGAVCDLPWAVRFPAGSLPHVHQVEKGIAFIHGVKLAPEDPPRIAAVEPASAAESSGIRPGDRILAVDEIPTATRSAAQGALMAAHTKGSQLCLAIAGRTQPVCFAISPPTSLPVHPTQIYSAINAFLICLFLLAFERFRQHDGQVVAMMFTVYPLTRFLLEILRDDEPWVIAGQNLGLTIAQTISLVLLAGAVILWLYIFRTKPGRWQAAAPSA